MIAQGTFRANPRYQLVLLDRLSPPERELLRELEGEDELYGVLRPRSGSGLDVRSVSSDTALLFLTLAQPGPLPGYLLARLGDDLDPTIGRLVLDGVLEIENGGEFVCGARAGEVVVSSRSEAGRGRPRSVVSRRAALRAGARSSAGAAARAATVLLRMPAHLSGAREASAGRAVRGGVPRDRARRIRAHGA